eukprot:2634552-Amphidinium_carterae.1
MAPEAVDTAQPDEAVEAAMAPVDTATEQPPEAVETEEQQLAVLSGKQQTLLLNWLTGRAQGKKQTAAQRDEALAARLHYQSLSKEEK